MMRPDVSIVIACYNEQGHLEQSVSELIEIMEATRWSYELIFVEDCSTDDTRVVIQRILESNSGRAMRAIFHEQNTGRGRTVADGLRAAEAPIAGFIDIDLEIHARYIPSFVIAVQSGSDLVMADREYRLHLGLLHRHLLSRGYAWLVRKVLKLPYRDTEAGYKFFNMTRILPVLDEVQDERWFWDTEIVARAHLHGLPVSEIPCLFIRRGDKQSTLRVVHDSIDYFRRLIRFRRNLDAPRDPVRASAHSDQ